MASSLLERARSLHEDIEVLEGAMYKELGDPSTTKLKRADQIAREQVSAARGRARGELPFLDVVIPCSAGGGHDAERTAGAQRTAPGSV